MKSQSDILMNRVSKGCVCLKIIEHTDSLQNERHQPCWGCFKFYPSTRHAVVADLVVHILWDGSKRKKTFGTRVAYVSVKLHIIMPMICDLYPLLTGPKLHPLDHISNSHLAVYLALTTLNSTLPPTLRQYLLCYP